MGLLQRLLGRAGAVPGGPPLGLADAAHPARRWIDLATAIADRRVELEWHDGRPALHLDASTLKDFGGALDLAVEAAPADADLRVVRACLRSLQDDAAGSREDLRRARAAVPGHVEAAVLERAGAHGQHLLFLSPWSLHSRLVHAVIAERANQGDALHAVRHCLQAALLLVAVGSEEEFGAAPLRWHWEFMLSRTPHGPLLAHYLLLDLGGKTRRQEFMLTPPPQPVERGDAPLSLLSRLAQARVGFIVLAAPDARVLHNLRLDLSDEQRRRLGEATAVLLAAAGQDERSRGQAKDWHMRRVALDDVQFPATVVGAGSRRTP